MVQTELTCVTGYIPRWLTHLQIVTHTIVLTSSPGSVTDTDTEVGIPNTEKYRIPKKKYWKKNDKSVFQFCKYNPLVIRVYARSGGQLSQIESFPRSVYSVILHKIIKTIQYSLS